MTSRLTQYFADRGESRALICFITAGDPSLEHTVPAMHAMVAGGANVIELGVPFSDPEAEGPVIQAASERALNNGTTLVKVLDCVAEFRRDDPHTPVVLMGYLNSILAMPNFARQASAAGADGVIMVNLPPEEGQALQQELAAVDMDVVYLIAPTTTDARAQRIVQAASGFVYYVSLKGITGANLTQGGAVAERVRWLKSQTHLPVCIGFGIKDAQTAKRLGADADGVVVGSALVELLAGYEDASEAAANLQAKVVELRQGLDQLLN